MANRVAPAFRFCLDNSTLIQATPICYLFLLTVTHHCKPYKKEDAFLEKVLDTIREGLRSSDTGLAGLAALLQSVQTAAPPPEPVMTDEDLDTAMDFINSL